MIFVSWACHVVWLPRRCQASIAVPVFDSPSSHLIPSSVYPWRHNSALQLICSMFCDTNRVL